MDKGVLNAQHEPCSFVFQSCVNAAPTESSGTDGFVLVLQGNLNVRIEHHGEYLICSKKSPLLNNKMIRV